MGGADPNLDPWGISYEKFGIIAIKGVQEQQLEINSSKDKISSLQGDLDITEDGRVNVVPQVDSQFSVESNGRKVNRIGAFAKAFVGTFTGGLIDAKTLTAENIKIGGRNLADYIDERIAALSSQNQSDNQAQIDDLKSQIASMQGVLATSTQSAQLTDLQNSIAQKQEDLANFQATTSGSVSSTQGGEGKFDKLRVTDSGLFEGIVSVLDTLNVGNLIVNNASTFFDQVVFKKSPTLPSSAGGYAIVMKGSREVKVVFSEAYEQEPIVNASLLVDPDGNVPVYAFALKDQSEKGFTIVLDKASVGEVKFAWSAVEVSSPKTSKSN